MEKPFVIRWNIIGFAGGGAFLLSFILGVLSGNPFLSILFRALLFGALFAVLGGASTFVLERFIPQIFEGGSTASRSAPASKNVDILLNEEDAEGVQAIEELSLDEQQAEPMPDGSPLTVGDGKQEEDEAATEQNEDSFIPEVSGQTSDDTISQHKEKEDELAAGLEEDTLEREPVLEQEAEAINRQPGKDEKTKESGETDLDVLPDMSHFESSFSPVTSKGTVGDTGMYESFDSDSLKEGKLEEDPATYVKAVRTVIHRDEGKRK